MFLPAPLPLFKPGLSSLVAMLRLSWGARGFAVIFLALLLSACTAPESINVPAAQAAVANAWQADQHTVWEIEWPAAPIGGSLTVETWRAGQRYRLEILEATTPDLVGQILIFDGQSAWRYNRFDLPPSPRQPGAKRLSPVTDAFAVIERLLGTTPESARQEPVQLLSGPAQKISLAFANDASLSLWRDEVTGLPGRIEFVVGGQSASLHARSFEPLSDPPEGLFKPQ